MDYKLKNRDGVETTYTKDKIKIPAATGDSRVVFTQGEAQAEKTVDITANGDFEVEPDAGFAFVKKVSGTVAVPTPVTSVNGKTGDVKTGMVVHATKNTDGTTYSLSPSVNEIIQFVNSNTPAPIQLLADGVVFDKYIYNNEDETLSFLDGENTDTVFERKTYLFIVASDPGFGLLVELSNQYSVIFNYNIITSDVSVFPDESMISGVLGGDLITWITDQANMGVFPVVIISGRPFPLPCPFSGAVTDDSGENIEYYQFRSTISDDITAVVKFTPSKTGSLRDMFSFSFSDTRATRMMIIHYDAESKKGDKTYAEIKNAIISGIPVSCSVGSQVLLLSSLSATTSESSGSDFLFSSSEIYGEQIYVTVAKVTKTDEWTVDTALFLHGIQYESPSGKKFTIQVADDGTLSTKEVPT